MAELDNLLGSRISLISQQDVRYDGVLFSINAKESAIVLRDVRCLGTEDRNSAAPVPADDTILPFVSFPGAEIKDLYVHEANEPPAAPEAVAESAPMPPAPPANTKPAPKAAPKTETKPAPRTASEQPQKRSENTRPAANNNRQPRSHAGTGEHLLHLREKRAGGGDMDKDTSEFDFASGLSAFNKNEVLAHIAEENPADTTTGQYNKDNFFDTLSCDVLEAEAGRRTRMTSYEERKLNQDTFGATALQSMNYHRNHRGGRGYRGRGRGGGRGPRPDGQQQQQRSDGGQRSNNNNRGGRGGGRSNNKPNAVSA